MENKDTKVLSFWVSPFGLRVEWALKLKGVEYEYIEEDVFNKSNLLLQMNQVHKKVPVLIHHNKPICESFVIMEYIDETWTQYPLMPQEPHQRAVTRFWASFAEEKVLQAAGKAMMFSGDEKKNNAENAKEAMEKIEELIKGKKFFGGENIGYLDLALGWISYFLPVMEEAGNFHIMDPLEFPAISSWKKNFLDHPIIKDTPPPREKTLCHLQSRIIAFASRSGD
ncbi:hypothetical protein QN277_007848 [Acacia crassicarpa]|uniref:Glutathione S-transferase n=1 Tax=Acacia crassicarpa TaxID=499986 RepID=A0AAE1IVW4_9FABA|nr:hypothetical protein QN277_007848 [Acacia crassicarpa]